MNKNQIILIGKYFEQKCIPLLYTNLLFREKGCLKIKKKSSLRSKVELQEIGALASQIKIVEDIILKLI